MNMQDGGCWGNFDFFLILWVPAEVFLRETCHIALELLSDEQNTKFSFEMKLFLIYIIAF